MTETIRFDAVRERIRAGDVHDPLVHHVGRRQRRDLARAHRGHVAVLGLGECAEQIGGEIGVGGEQLVLDDDEMVDRIVATRRQCVVAGLVGVGDEPCHVRVVGFDADRGGQVARGQQVGEVGAGRHRYDVRRRLVFGHVLVAG